jgi:hypothetical protein
MTGFVRLGRESGDQVSVISDADEKNAELRGDHSTVSKAKLCGTGKLREPTPIALKTRQERWT